MKRKCRALCPWSRTASPFMDHWRKLCNRLHEHAGLHQSANGVRWDADAIVEPPGILTFGYTAEKRAL